ncbi:GTP 3',8-cyclase MoaA [Flavisolibacter ginsenosidimutans]|uniref:GTP 3',8-cyclase n=1 Tax=Flavisolibacter ginsenosidimutans TaxID=661481 RepID=A0A5B8UHJ8_9BACT|nr:GTP 3',8-cyclase MoaA [Flavisolibacter ginsenosidimutans]QEC56114.1 GTP 3',8-cyclase MoaA [Flavisolibacter ginsenosidimutans]
MLLDGFNRQHNYLRISLTDKCNMRCFYCMPEEDYDFMPSEQLMQATEVESLAKIFVSLGVEKIRLTGGEPLVRKDAAQIIEALGRMPVTLSLTTNGVRLHEFLSPLKTAGVRSLNISLDTLNADKFNLVTRRNHFGRVWRNIHAAVAEGLHVKVNVVLMKGMNDAEINDFIEWTKNTPVHVRFIEFMPFDGNRWNSDKVVSLAEILQTIESRYSVIKLEDAPNDTTKKYTVPGHAGTFAVISTMTQPFCGTCNRIRLTADGRLKNCLFAREETDLLTALRTGENVEDLIRQNILRKHASHGGQFSSTVEEVHGEQIHNRSMIAIGG